ncbi:MAG: oligosaccharide flippase family protein, partial [Isosphaeraceae bacterium]
LASNFGFLLVAEVACRGASLVATLALTERLRAEGFGRVEFSFNVVFWLVLIVRDCFETIITREIARHPAITRSLVNRVLALKFATATGLYAVMLAVAALGTDEPADIRILSLYGLLLFSTSAGLDFVFRGKERVGLVAVSLCLRTTIYCLGVLTWVRSPADIEWVPAWLVGGEAVGIALVWLVYSRSYGLPRPRLSTRFLAVVIRRGRSVAVIQICQAVLVTADLMVVGLLTSWSDVGRYSAPQRMVAALMAFGLIVQQVLLPSMARNWRRSEESGRQVFEFAVRLLMLVFIPIAVGGTVLAEPLSQRLFPSSFSDAGRLLAIGVWRAPLLSLAFLYQTALIAMNRETAGVRLLVGGAVACTPLIALGHVSHGLAGASYGVMATALILVLAGYACMAREGRAPAWHHHVLIPFVSALAMIPICRWAQERSLVIAIGGSAAVYAILIVLLGGFRGLMELRPSPARLVSSCEGRAHAGQGSA